MGNAFLTCLLLSGAMISQAACVKPPPQVQVFRMGERAQAGPLIYNVFEADWRPQLGEGPMARRPAHRFLIVHLSVTNSGAEVLSAPGLRLLDDDGHLYSETIDGQNVPSWLGLVRKLKPADTLEGNILFDVDPKSYKLKLDDDSDPDRKVLVEMPLRFGVENPSLPSN